jgi:hypothetical protein
MLLDFCEQDLRPTIESEVTRLAKDSQEAVTKALAEIQLHDFVKDAKTLNLTEVKTEKMLAALKGSAVGRELVANLEDKGDSLFKRLTERYEAAGARVTATFRRRARIYSTLTAMLLALALSIDSVHLIDMYMRAPAARTAAAASMDAVMKRAEGSIVGASNKGLEEALSKARAELHALQASTLPLGWSNFPYCRTVSADTRCIGEPTRYACLAWLIGCLLTGYLTGFGATFWKDVLKWITGVTRVGGVKATAAAAAPGSDGSAK